jgi:hypothetical protein
MATFTEISPRKKQSSTWKFVKYFIAFVFVATITGVNGVLLYLNYQNQNQTPAAQTPKTNEEIAQEVIKSFGEIYQIPEGENPTVILVTDAETLRAKQPEFYGNAQNGDHVIVVFSSKLAFIFRASEKKIINVSQVSIDNAGEPTPETTQ